MKTTLKSRIALPELVRKAEGYLTLGEYVESRVEAFRTVFTHEMNVAAKELRHEDHGKLHEVYHRIIMATPLMGGK